MFRRLLLTFALVFMFGLGQQGAVVHEISHFADINPTSHKQDKAPHSQLCEKCFSYSGLVSLLGVSCFTPKLLVTNFEHYDFKSINQLSYYLVTYSARAPPVFS